MNSYFNLDGTNGVGFGERLRWAPIAPKGHFGTSNGSIAGFETVSVMFEDLKNFMN